MKIFLYIQKNRKKKKFFITNLKILRSIKKKDHKMKKV